MRGHFAQQMRPKCHSFFDDVIAAKIKTILDVDENCVTIAKLWNRYFIWHKSVKNLTLYMFMIYVCICQHVSLQQIL